MILSCYNLTEISIGFIVQIIITANPLQRIKLGARRQRGGNEDNTNHLLIKAGHPQTLVTSLDSVALLQIIYQQSRSNCSLRAGFLSRADNAKGNGHSSFIHSTMRPSTAATSTTRTTTAAVATSASFTTTRDGKLPQRYKLHLSPPISVTRLGDFCKFLVPNFLTKVAKIFGHY